MLPSKFIFEFGNNPHPVILNTRKDDLYQIEIVNYQNKVCIT